MNGLGFSTQRGMTRQLVQALILSEARKLVS
jgi:hypothetical protein